MKCFSLKVMCLRHLLLRSSHVSLFFGIRYLCSKAYKLITSLWNSSPSWSFFNTVFSTTAKGIKLAPYQANWKGILDAFNYHTPGSLHDKIRKSSFWRIWIGFNKHDINEQNHPFDVQYCLSKMKGTVYSFDLGEFLLSLFLNQHVFLMLS